MARKSVERQTTDNSTEKSLAIYRRNRMRCKKRFRLVITV